MASSIKIKRSEVAGNPSVLGAGELAYSSFSGAGGDRLYIGMGTETAGDAVNHVVIGGKYFTDMVTAATDANTVSTLVKRDASGNFTAGTITAALSGNASTATAWATGRTLSLTGDVTYTSGSLTGTADVTGTATLANTAVTAGTYGSTTALPTFTVDSKGRLTAASNTLLNTIKLSAFAATTSAELAGVISDETGSGLLVFATSPSLTTPVLGAATATTINKVTITAPTTSATLTLATGSSLITSGAFALTLTSTAATNVTLPTTGTLATLLGTETLSNKTLSLVTSITGTAALTITAGGTNTNITLAPNGTGTVDVSSKRITNLADPTGAQDAATKNYVDTTVQGLDPKASVKAATTANITLSAPQTIDGIALIAGDRVLVKDQTTAAQNGIYVVAAGAWSRATDADTWAELPSAYVFAESGTVNADIGYLCTVDQVGTLGTTAITFQQFTGAGSFTAGAGLTKTGNIIDAVGTTDRITVNADSIDIASTYAGQTSITTLGTVASGTWQATAIGYAYGGTGTSTYAKGDILYASATNVLSKLTAGTEGQFLQMVSGVPTWVSLDGGTFA